MEVKKQLATILGIALSVFLIATASFMRVPPMTSRGLALLMATILILLYFPLSKKEGEKTLWKKATDYILIVLSIICMGYIVVFQADLAMRIGQFTMLDKIIALSGTIIVLEITRRTSAPALVIIALIFVGYVFLGQYLPGFLRHPGYKWDDLVTCLFLGQEAIFGTVMNVMVTLIYMFLFFGAVMNITGAGKYFIDFALGLTGRVAGGPALTAVVASSLMGTVSGSPVANVTATGTFTIPLMRKVGYDPIFAGAVEAVASTGGQIMPPVMGATAFIMSEIIGVPYAKIILCAIIPAFLYYLCCGISVYFRAKIKGLEGLSKKELPSAIKALKEGWFLFAAVFVLAYLILQGLSPGYAAFWATLVLILFSYTNKNNRMKLVDYKDALARCAKESLTLFSSLACVGIVIGIISLTGLGIKFSILLTNAAGSSLFLALIYAAIGALIFGMGLPPVAAYVVLASVMGPALEMLGLERLVAHMFMFYFGAIAPITPPVALAAYAAAGITKADPMKIGWQAVRLGAVSFIVPFAFVYSPTLLLIGTASDIAMHCLTAILGALAIAIGSEGYCFRAFPSKAPGYFLRLMAVASGILLIWPNMFYALIGVVFLVVVVAFQFLFKRNLDTKIATTIKPMDK